MGIYWVFWLVLGFTGFYWVLLGYKRVTRFYWLLPGFNWVLLGFTGFYWVLRTSENSKPTKRWFGLTKKNYSNGTIWPFAFCVVFFCFLRTGFSFLFVFFSRILSNEEKKRQSKLGNVWEHWRQRRPSLVFVIRNEATTKR